ncbi:MAG: N-acetylmuramoyl-L-alanine amidase [Planctomycetes bacterium]|nr:N-acetylmuramoyl-L-alanine amidase [Planctomycetota bacterium]
MFKMRTVKVLGALVAAMTAGIGVLVLINGEPVRPQNELAAIVPLGQNIANITDTEKPVVLGRWKNVVVHSVKSADESMEGTYHFIVQPPDENGRSAVTATRLWRAQADGNHIAVAGYSNSECIGVCLIGDFSAEPPADGQLKSLVAHVKSLQAVCHIPSASVYLYGELDSRGGSPGKAFPAGEFNYRIGVNR